jgi:predicted nucleotidyltransferase component of viral defense system
MNENQLNAYVRELGISRDQILREEAEMEILSEFAKSKLSAKMVFYGGTALRLVYGSPRFSEDLDFLVIKKTNFSEFKNFAEDLIKKRDNWKLKDIIEKRKTMFALVGIVDPMLKHSFSVKIEAHRPQPGVKVETELSLIKSPFSVFEPLLLAPTLNELRRLKEAALENRKKGRDVFDLWYITKSLRENFILPDRMPKYSKREFINELRVFLPKKYYPVIDQLYEQIKTRNK